MNGFDWDNIRYFLAAARAGSLSAASRALNSNQPTVGRRIDALETELGMRLFQRHNGGLTLTEEGRRLLEGAELMEQGGAGIAQASRGDAGTPAGRVRVAMPEGLGIGVFTPRLPELYARYPLLDVVLEPAIPRADLKRGQADIAVRLMRPEDEDMVSRRLCEMGLGLYASAPYLAQNGEPASVAELAGHALIGYGDLLAMQAENVWLEGLAGDARFVFRSDNTLARLSALLSGVGIAVMPHVLMAGQPGCVQVLPQHEPSAHTVWLAVHGDLRHLARIRAVMDFIASVVQCDGVPLAA